jgi:NodT family efflux transporter outer membrane factor (OMF) lipoprotein
VRRLPIALTVALSACVGPRPEAPPAAQVTAPAGWREAAGVANSVRADWWAAFGDPVLTALVDRALANNPDLGAAAARVEEARAAARLAQAQQRPNIGGAATGAEAQTVGALGSPLTALATSPQVQASYDLDLFGRLRQASRAARAQALAQAGARDTVRLAVASGVASGYVTLRALDLRLAVARATLASRAEQLRIARRRAETGYTSALELHQAESEYHATEQLIPQAELAIRRQENALSLLAGDAPGPVARGLPLDRLVAPAVRPGLPSDLLRRRPDLFQAEQALVAADRSLDSARAAFLPSIALTGSAGIAISSALDNPVALFSLGASVLAPILDGGRTRAQADVAAARRDQAAFAYRDAALTAFRETEDALAGVRRSGEQAASLQAQVDALAAGLRNAVNRYRAGYSSYLDQLDAQRSLLSAQLALVQARADRLTALVALYQALGGGWAVADEAPRR